MKLKKEWFTEEFLHAYGYDITKSYNIVEYIRFVLNKKDNIYD